MKSESSVSIHQDTPSLISNWINNFILAPYQLLAFSAALLLLIDLGAIYTLSVAPHPNITFRAEGDKIIASKKLPDKKLSLEISDEVLILKGRHKSINLYTSDLMEEPDFLITTKNLDHFFKKQQTITTILKEDIYTILDADGNELKGSVLEAKITSIPIMFWLQLFVGNIGFLVGIALLSFQRANNAALHYCWTGVGLALAAISAAIYSSRPVSLPGRLFDFLSSTNQVGTLLFSAAFLSMVWHYPKALFGIRFSPWVYFTASLIFLSEYFDIVETLDLTRRLPAITVLVLACLILVMQWIRSKGDPLERQTLKWFVFITLSGSTFFVVMVMIPPVIGLPTSISQGAAFIAFLTIYLGLAVGISKYPLFDLDRYWVKITYWSFASLILIGIDLALVTVLHVSEVYALWITLAVFGWIYFPLRALLDRLVFFRSKSSIESQLPIAITAIASSDSHTTLVSAWENQIEKIFQPIERQTLPLIVDAATVVKRGLGIVVPGIDGKHSYLLEHAEMGRRLFTTTDTKIIQSLQELFDLAHKARTARNDGIQEERIRIKKDIHDTLGGRLLTILHRAKDPRIVNESRQAMSELRDILAAVEDHDSLLSTTISNWHDQFRHQLEIFRVTLYWHVEDTVKPWKIEGRVRLNLGRMLTEAITNVLRHASAKSIKVNFSVGVDYLNLTIENDGECGDPKDWRAGNGMNNIRTRAKELHGEVRWTLTSSGKMRMDVNIPLQSNLS